MSATVLLKEIVGALEMSIEESSSFLDLDTGEVENIPDDVLSRAEEETVPDPHLPDWQKQEWEVAKRIVSTTDRFVRLPTQFDIHEWAILQDFSYSVTSESIRKDLLHAIHNKGAFARFKQAIRRHGIEPAWFTFRDEALKQIAIDWCEEHHIQWR